MLDCAYKEPGGRTRGCLTYHRGQDSGTVFSDGGKRKFHVCMCDSVLGEEEKQENYGFFLKKKQCWVSRHQDNCNGEGRYMDYVKKLVAGNVVRAKKKGIS